MKRSGARVGHGESFVALADALFGFICHNWCWLPRHFVPAVGSDGPPFVEIPSGQQIGSARTIFNTVQHLPFSIGWEGSKSDKSGTTALNENGSFNFIGLISRR